MVTAEDFKSQHTPLDHATSAIRLVRVRPSLSADGFIQCEISERNLPGNSPDDDANDIADRPATGKKLSVKSQTNVGDEPQPHMCLSYTWGDPNDQGTIRVNGKFFAVRKNLADFLEVARSTLFDELLWIDALGIDQSNILERNHQVQLMGRIYSGAHSVLTWLGNDIEVCNVVRLLNKAKKDSNLLEYDSWDRHTSLWNSQGSIVWKFSYRARSIGTSSDRSQCEHSAGVIKLNDQCDIDSQSHGDVFNIFADNTGKVEKVFEKLAENPYWSRAWVTQEVLLAKSVVLIAGNEAYSLSALAKTYRSAVPYYKDSAYENLLDLVLMQHRRKISQYRMYWDDSATGLEDWHLIQLLHRFRDKSCAIRRDRIYSLLALTQHGTALEVDYNVSEEKLMGQVLSMQRRPMCLCSVAICAHALAPWEFPVLEDVERSHGQVAETPFAEIHMYGCGLSSAICSFCQNYTPSPWTRKKGVVFCLQTACPDTQGHIFLESKDSVRGSHTKPETAHQLTEGSLHTQLRRNNKSQILCENGSGVSVFPSEWKDVFLLRFTLRRLIEVLQDNMNAGDLGLNACGNLWPSISNPRSARKGRLRLCDGV
jgi:hypothetical protein